MKARLLDYLVCPLCEAELDLQIQEQHSEGEILAGKLTCRQCARTYPITRGIPRMIPGQLESDKEKTAENFGWQWQKFPEIFDEYEEDLFLDWVKPLPREFFKDKVILDAGCGTGRHSYYAAKFGAKELISIDLSDAVETAYRTLGNFPNAHVVQADIYRLPFRRGSKAQFDFVYSIAVLHHTPDPEKAFLSLLPHLQEQGTMFAWVYGYENNGIIHYGIDPVRKLLTSRLPPKALYYLSFLVALVLQALVKGVYKPVNEVPALKRFSKYLYYNSYFYHISKFTFKHNHNIVHDHLTAPTAFYIKREDFENWFKKGSLKDIGISWRNENSWRGWGIKPQTQSNREADELAARQG